MQTTTPSGTDAPPDAPASGRTGLRRVVAQEVDCLPDLADRVGGGLAGFADREADQRRHLLLQALGGALERRGTVGRRHRLPGRRGALGSIERGRDVGGARFDDRTDHGAPVGRVAHRLRSATVTGMPGDQRNGAPCRRRAVLQRAAERFEDVLVRQVEAARVAPHAAVQLGRPHDRRMRRTERSALLSDPARGLDRIGDQLVDVDVRVGDAVDERRVGAVLQQAADEVCEQRLVGADRRIDAARPAEPAVGARRDDVGVQRLAHSVQALELVQSAVRVDPRQRRDGGQRVRVVGRELRVDRIRRGEQLAGAGEIRDVGVALAREDRVVVEAVDLRALDLAVPVRAFDEPDHQPMPAAARELDQVRRAPRCSASGRPARRSRCRASRRARAQCRGARAGRAKGRGARPPRHRC
jgi:hypothetical protein